MFDYETICQDLVSDLAPRVKDVVSRRFGLEKENRETLQQIGSDYGITRERVRQIEHLGLAKLQEKALKQKPIFDFFTNQLETSGKLRKEDSLLKILGPDVSPNYIFFLLSLAKGFERILETDDIHTAWTIAEDSLEKAKKYLHRTENILARKKRPLAQEELESATGLGLNYSLPFLEVSKRIQKGPDGNWGLAEWPEISPHGVKDKIYIILKREKRPLHFTEVARLINESNIFSKNKNAHPQTVHNELIKGPVFILVGRGLYGLKEWGYKPGIVKEVVLQTLKEAKKPLPADEIVNRVSKQRMVEKNTILLNLRNKKLFSRDSLGRYFLRL